MEMNEQKQLAKAIKIAAFAHENQTDKGGNPYILHPLHLMNQLLFDTQLATIAILHDVVEDSLVSFGALMSDGFSPRIINALKLLTHLPDEDYMTYIEKMSGNYDAIRVKRKDLEHNSDITRLKGVTEKDLQRIEKYHKAFTMLGEYKVKFQE